MEGNKNKNLILNILSNFRVGFAYSLKENVLRPFSEPSRREGGFTFVELLIYISILALFIGSFTMMSVNMLQARTSTVAIEEVAQNGQYAMDRISRSIEDADDFQFNALEFDGESDYVEIPHDNSFHEMNNLTLVAWVYIPSSLPKNYNTTARGIFYKGSMVGAYGLNWLSGYSNPPRNEIFYEVSTVNSGRVTLSPSDVLNFDQWNYMALTYDSSTVYAYVNGEKVASAPASGAVVSNTGPLYIGFAGSDRYVPGEIDNVRIYNRALSEEEVEDVYQGKDITEGLIGYWKLNEGRGSVTYDSSGNNNHGELINGPVWTQANRRTGEIELVHKEEELSPIRIGLEDGKIFLQEGTKRKEYLTGEDVIVTDLEFINTTRSLEALGTIKIKMTIEYDNETGRKEMSYENTFITTVNVR